MNFDMNRTWSGAVALVQSNFQLLAVIAGVFILVPNLLFYLAVPDLMTEASSTSADPERLVAMLAENAGVLVGVGLVVIVAQFIGYAALVALMGGNRPTVAEALRQSLGAIFTLLGVTVLTMIAYMVVGMALTLVAGIIVGILAAVGGAAGSALGALIVVALLFVGMIYIVARFSMVYPAVLLEGISNPVAAMKRSWALTKPQAKRIFLFLMLLLVAYLVISLIIGAVFGVIIALLGTGTFSALASGLLNGLLGALVAMIYAGIMVAMHKQLAGTDTAEISEAFD